MTKSISAMVYPADVPAVLHFTRDEVDALIEFGVFDELKLIHWHGCTAFYLLGELEEFRIRYDADASFRGRIDYVVGIGAEN